MPSKAVVGGNARIGEARVAENAALFLIREPFGRVGTGLAKELSQARGDDLRGSS